VVCAFSWIKIGIWRQKRAKFQNFSPFSDRQKMLLLNLDWYINVFLASNCLTVSNVPSIRASDPKIGIDLSDNGHLAGVVERIPSDVEAIYFEFFLDIPEGSEITL